MPRIIQNVTESVAKHSPGIANKLQNLNDRIRGNFGYERKIVISEHKIFVRYKPKGHTGKYSGKSDFYSNGEIYLKGHANPIKISPHEVSENGEVDLVSSQKYKNAVSNQIIEQALNTPSDEYTLAEKLLMALVGLVAMAIAAGVFVFVM